VAANLIDDSFTQDDALCVADINGDGLTDLSPASGGGRMVRREISILAIRRCVLVRAEGNGGKPTWVRIR